GSYDAPLWKRGITARCRKRARAISRRASLESRHRLRRASLRRRRANQKTHRSNLSRRSKALRTRSTIEYLAVCNDALFQALLRASPGPISEPGPPDGIAYFARNARLPYFASGPGSWFQ